MNKIIYEDNHLLVAVKPAGIPVQADSSGDDDFLSQLKRYIGKKYNKPGAVYLGLLHRLDRPASGVMVFARTSKAASRLTSQFKKGSIGKYYLAVVEGIPPESGKLRDFLLKDHERNIVRTCASGRGYTRIPPARGLRRPKSCTHKTRHRQITSDTSAIFLSWISSRRRQKVRQIIGRRFSSFFPQAGADSPDNQGANGVLRSARGRRFCTVRPQWLFRHNMTKTTLRQHDIRRAVFYSLRSALILLFFLFLYSY